MKRASYQFKILMLNTFDYFDFQSIRMDNFKPKYSQVMIDHFCKLLKQINTVQVEASEKAEIDFLFKIENTDKLTVDLKRVM